MLCGPRKYWAPWYHVDVQNWSSKDRFTGELVSHLSSDWDNFIPVTILISYFGCTTTWQKTPWNIRNRIFWKRNLYCEISEERRISSVWLQIWLQLGRCCGCPWVLGLFSTAKWVRLLLTCYPSLLVKGMWGGELILLGNPYFKWSQGIYNLTKNKQAKTPTMASDPGLVPEVYYSLTCSLLCHSVWEREPTAFTLRKEGQTAVLSVWLLGTSLMQSGRNCY